MRKKLDTTGNVFPMPVLMVATYNEDGSVDVMNAAWGTMQESGIVALNLSESHHPEYFEKKSLYGELCRCSPRCRS